MGRKPTYGMYTITTTCTTRDIGYQVGGDIGDIGGEITPNIT